MVDFRVLYDQVIKLVTDKHKLGLGDFAINEHKWELLRQLCNVLKVRTESYIMFYSLYNLPLQVLKDATLFFPHLMPSLVMDYINEVFTQECFSKIPSILRSVLLLALPRRPSTSTMSALMLQSFTASPWVSQNKYDIYTVFFLILSLVVLHPWHKLEYFQIAGWEPEWIHDAQQLVHAPSVSYIPHTMFPRLMLQCWTSQRMSLR